MTDLVNDFGVITGAAEGLGNKIVRACAQEGMRLALMDVQAEKLNTLTDELQSDGVDCLPISVGLADAIQTREAIQQELDHYGTPRVLIHNAAVLNERLFKIMVTKLNGACRWAVPLECGTQVRR